MSVYLRPNSSVYWCEFWLDGVRHRRSTEEKEKRQARVAEKRIKADAKAAQEAEQARRAAWGGKPPPTMAYVTGRYWEEVGKHHAAEETTFRSIEWLALHFGEQTLITEITTDRIAEMVARRRGIRVVRDRKTEELVEVPCETVQNATVNRYATDVLRKLFLRARDVWRYPVVSPKWGDFRLREPEERVREAVGDEEEKILAALGPDYGRLFRFMMAAGTRSQGSLLTWRQIDRRNRTARIRGKSKDGQERWYTIPLTNRQIAILDECVGHHPTHVFTYTVERSRTVRGELRDRGERKPITDSGFKTHWRRHVHEAGIAPGFRRHDTRHTVGTRYVRHTGNLKGAQKLLGHSRIETTMRYAHVLIDDIRSGLEAVEMAQDARNTHISHPQRSKA